MAGKNFQNSQHITGIYATRTPRMRVYWPVTSGNARSEQLRTVGSTCNTCGSGYSSCHQSGTSFGTDSTERVTRARGSNVSFTSMRATCSSTCRPAILGDIPDNTDWVRLVLQLYSEQQLRVRLVHCVHAAARRLAVAADAVQFALAAHSQCEQQVEVRRLAEAREL